MRKAAKDLERIVRALEDVDELDVAHKITLAKRAVNLRRRNVERTIGL